VSDLICPKCKQINDGCWVYIKIKDKYEKVCEECAKDPDKEPTTNINNYFARKKRQDRDRQERNTQVIQQYKLKPKKSPK
jgi:hypothetical protein